MFDGTVVLPVLTLGEPAIGLRRGADIYAALRSMLGEASYDIEDLDLEGAVAEIEKLDPIAADQFQRGRALLERRDTYRDKKRAQYREGILAQYRGKIEAYLQTIEERPQRYGSRRGWIGKFLEEFVVLHGHLPLGKHQIRVEGGGRNYSGGDHDFGDYFATKPS